jgi:hypothetical protein
MQILIFLVIGWAAFAVCTSILGAIDRVVQEGNER